MNTLYSLSILIYGLGIRIAGIFNPKARRWVEGRRRLFRKLEEALKRSENNWKGNVWFHCASLGEFEQGRPVIEGFRELFPEYRIILTFYSPSGYDVKKSYAGAEGIFYMPLDTPGNAKRWIRILNPKLVFFIKYEYWFNFLTEINRKNIPVFIVSAIFHKNQPFFKGYGGWFRKQLKHISWFFLQSEDAKNLAESLGIKHFTISGDTRFDRVCKIREQPTSFPLIEQFARESRIFIGGSTWEPDESLILGLIKENIPDLKFIIAPHEVHETRIHELYEKLRAQGTGHRAQGTGHRAQGTGHRAQNTNSPVHQFTSSPVLLYSELTPENSAAARILIIDSIGMLAHLYQYSTFAWIGGGFGVGIHNILEAAVFGNPVMFGPNFQKFTEARELIHLGGAYCLQDENELTRIISDLIASTNEYNRVSSICKSFVENGQGATRRITQGIQTLGFITPSRKPS